MGKARGRISVEIAKRLLMDLGYVVIKVSEPVTIRDREISEVDLIVADANGNKYAVEVKAGRLDVSGVRQAKVNADLLGLQPMVVARGFADDAARLLAEKLGVKVVNLSDLIAVSEIELYSIVKEAVFEAMSEFFSSLQVIRDKKALEFLRALADSESLDEACRKLGLHQGECERLLGRLRRKGLIPLLRGYKGLRDYARAILAFEDILKSV